MHATAFAVIAKHAGNAPTSGEQRNHRHLHEHFHALVNAVILQCANQLKAGSVTNVRQARIAVSTEVALQDLAFLGAVKDGAPGFEFQYARGRLLGMVFNHDGVVQVLAAAHGVCEVDFPVVAVIDIAHGRSHATLSHHGVRFTKQGLANHANLDARSRCLDRCAQTCAAGADDKHVMFMHDVLISETHKILKSVQVPFAHKRT